MVAGSKLKWYTPKAERELEISGLKIIELIIDRFAAAVDYRYYRLLKKLSQYEDDVEHQ